MPKYDPPAVIGGPAVLGFYNTTPQPKSVGFVNTYSTADKTLSAYTPNVKSTAFTVAPATLTIAATLADLNLLRVAYENLRVFTEDLAQQHNSLIATFKANGLIGS